jgi:membrane fusion protein (multidrug efflux system)
MEAAMAKLVRRIMLGGVLLLALAGLVSGGRYWWTEGRFLQSTDDAYVQSDISVVSPKIAGYVREVRVTDNQQVAAGEVLVVIDDQDFRTRIAETEAAVEAQRAAMLSNASRLALQRAMIDQAAAGLAAAQAEERRAGLELQRVRSLVTGEWASRQKLELAEADHAKAQAAIARARAGLSAEKDQIAVLDAAGREIEARRHQAEAAQASARNDLAATVIRAPVAGVIGNRSVQVGQFARTGVQLLAVVPLREVYVVANFKETQLSRMRPGQPVELRIDAFSDQPLVGRVESFAPASGARFSLLPPENATGNFTKIVQRVPVRIKVAIDNPLAGMLRPGLSVTVAVDTRGADQMPTLAGAAFGAAQAAEPRP